MGQEFTQDAVEFIEQGWGIDAAARFGGAQGAFGHPLGVATGQTLFQRMGAPHDAAGLEKLGVHGAGAGYANRDAAFFQFSTNGFGELEDEGFGGAINGHAGIGRKAGD